MARFRLLFLGAPLRRTQARLAHWHGSSVGAVTTLGFASLLQRTFYILLNFRSHGLFLFFRQVYKSILMVLLGISQFAHEAS